MNDAIGYPDWRLSAACSEQDVALFFVGSGPSHFENHVQAKAICARCPVLAECRTFVDRIEADQRSSLWAGVWAGETVPERRARRATQAAGRAS